jgi:hypothetical protein
MDRVGIGRGLPAQRISEMTVKSLKKEKEKKKIWKGAVVRHLMAPGNRGEIRFQFYVEYSIHLKVHLSHVYEV